MKSVAIGIVCFALGALLCVAMATRHANVAMSPTPQAGAHNGIDHTARAGSTHTDETMDAMVNSLQGKSGDEFDMIFLVGMIGHHQGAIDTANLAKEHAKHPEIKQMADEIIAAQSREIEQMQAWQHEWGY